MARRLMTFASALSLLLCIGTVGFWERSHESRQEVQFRWHGKTYALASERGRVGIDNLPQFLAFSEALEPADKDVRDVQAAYKGGGDYDPFLADLVRATDRRFALIGRGPSPVRFVVPYWVIIVSLLFLPAIRARKLYRRRLRIAGNRCAECGYDRRASSARCPECGRPTER